MPARPRHDFDPMPSKNVDESETVPRSLQCTQVSGLAGFPMPSISHDQLPSQPNRLHKSRKALRGTGEKRKTARGKAVVPTQAEAMPEAQQSPIALDSLLLDSLLPPIPQYEFTEQGTMIQRPPTALRRMKERRESSTSSMFVPPPIALRPRPPKAQVRPNVSPEDMYFIPPPAFRATIFPSAGVTRVPSRGLHDSDRIQQVLESKQLDGIFVDPIVLYGEYDRRESMGLTLASTCGRQSLGEAEKLVVTTPVSLYGCESVKTLETLEDTLPTTVYGVQVERRPKLSLETSTPMQRDDIRFTPTEIDLGTFESLSTLPEIRRPSLQKDFGDTVIRKSAAVFVDGLKATASRPRDSIRAEVLQAGSILTVVTPEQNAWRRVSYLPGAIQVQSRSKIERTPVEIIMDSFDPDKPVVENALMDNLLEFVESYGDGFTASNTALESYWAAPPLRMHSRVTSRSSIGSASLLQAASSTSGPPTTACNRSLDERILTGENYSPYDNASVHDYHNYKTIDTYMAARRDSFAPSQRSGSTRTMISSRSTPNSLTDYSPPLYNSSCSNSLVDALPIIPPMGLVPISSTTGQRRVKQVKGKGPTSGGSKLSFRKLLSSASAVI